jgi:metallo-beta-lactamase family protein
VHRPLEESLGIFEEAINDAYKKGGRLLIPAFSIMRTHMLWNFVYNLYKADRLPMQFYSSSPSADTFARIFYKYLADLSGTAQEQFKNKMDSPFWFNKLKRIRTLRDTMEMIKTNTDPFGLTASSGMCDFGRIVTILPYIIPDPKNIVLGTGYAAEGTRMWQMLNGAKYLDFNETAGRVQLKADVRRMGGLSGHADLEETLAHLKNIDPDRKLKKIFIKHGEKENCYALRNAIIKRLHYDPSKVIVMKKAQAYDLAA